MIKSSHLTLLTERQRQSTLLERYLKGSGHTPTLLHRVESIEKRGEAVSQVRIGEVSVLEVVRSVPLPMADEWPTGDDRLVTRFTAPAFVSVCRPNGFELTFCKRHGGLFWETDDLRDPRAYPTNPEWINGLHKASPESWELFLPRNESTARSIDEDGLLVLIRDYLRYATHHLS